MDDTLATFAIPLLLLSLLLIYLGRHGRRTDRHPRCPDCGYDLAGTHRDYRCSECGCIITPWHDYKVGNRRPMRELIYAGYVLLLLASVGCFTLLAGLNNPKTAAAYKPLFLLRLDVRAGLPQSRDAALSELLNRFTAGDLSPEDLKPIVDNLLAIQADPKKNWTAAAGNFIEDLQAKNTLAPEQWNAYVTHCLSFDAAFNSLLPNQSGVALALQPHPRAGASPPLYVTYTLNCSAAPIPLQPIKGTFSVPLATGYSSTSTTLIVYPASVDAGNIRQAIPNLTITAKLTVKDSTTSPVATPITFDLNIPITNKEFFAAHISDSLDDDQARARLP